jgi:hypothetical protein
VLLERIEEQEFPCPWLTFKDIPGLVSLLLDCCLVTLSMVESPTVVAGTLSSSKGNIISDSSKIV